MKKLIVTLALCAVCAAGAFAQDGAGSVNALLNVKGYSSLFLNGGGKPQGKYFMAASDEDFYRIAALGGDIEDIDISLEIALLSSCAGVIDIRPAAADAILPKADLALTDKKLGAVVLQEL
jgi:hypothetical protein